jgi:hypothetical protein
VRKDTKMRNFAVILPLVSMDSAKLLEPSTSTNDRSKMRKGNMLSNILCYVTHLILSHLLISHLLISHLLISHLLISHLFISHLLISHLLISHLFISGSTFLTSLRKKRLKHHGYTVSASLP